MAIAIAHRQDTRCAAALVLGAERRYRTAARVRTTAAWRARPGPGRLRVPAVRRPATRTHFTWRRCRAERPLGHPGVAPTDRRFGHALMVRIAAGAAAAADRSAASAAAATARRAATLTANCAAATPGHATADAAS